MPYFEEDAQTEAIVIYTESGGRMEAELVDWRDTSRIGDPDRRVHGGQVHGRRGDAGHELRPCRHIVEGKEDSATEKIARLEAAGIPVVERIDEIPKVCHELL